jgi:hypothetical protein
MRPAFRPHHARLTVDFPYAVGRFVMLTMDDDIARVRPSVEPTTLPVARSRRLLEPQAHAGMGSWKLMRRS